MRKYALLAGLAMAACAMPAEAATYLTNYTSDSGATSAAFSITTSDALNARGGYDILSLSGNVNGDTISGLIPNPHQPTSSLSASGKWNFDNVYYDRARILDSDGMVFTTASGLEYNLWGTSNTEFTLASAVQANGSWSYGARTNGYMGAPPATPTPLASYDFDGSLAAKEGGQQALTEQNPSGTNHFSTSSVFGRNQGVYDFNTNVSAGGGGLTYDVDQNLVNDGYSVVMTVQFTGSDADFRNVRLVDPGNPPGTYVFNVSNVPNGTRVQLGAWGRDGDSYLFGLNQWHNVAVTNAGDYTCIYFDGLKGICAGASFTAMNLRNADQVLSFLKTYLSEQNAVGSVAALSIYSGAISSRDALALTAIPAAPVPEAATWAMMLGGFGAVGSAMRRRGNNLRFA